MSARAEFPLGAGRVLSALRAAGSEPPLGPAERDRTGQARLDEEGEPERHHDRHDQELEHRALHLWARRRRIAAGASGHPVQAAALTSIVLASGFATATFGTEIFRIPFAMLAVMFSALTLSGRTMERENEP